MVMLGHAPLVGQNLVDKLLLQPGLWSGCVGGTQRLQLGDV